MNDTTDNVAERTTCAEPVVVDPLILHMATSSRPNLAASTAEMPRQLIPPAGAAMRLAGFVVTSVSLVCRELRREVSGESDSVLVAARFRTASIEHVAVLCRTLRGSKKQSILKALRHPPATIGSGRAHADDTWYYPLDVDRRTILAIQFEDDRVQEVEVVNLSHSFRRNASGSSSGGMRDW